MFGRHTRQTGVHRRTLCERVLDSVPFSDRMMSVTEWPRCRWQQVPYAMSTDRVDWAQWVDWSRALADESRALQQSNIFCPTETQRSSVRMICVESAEKGEVGDGRGRRTGAEIGNDWLWDGRQCYFWFLAKSQFVILVSKQASNFIRQNNEKIQIYCWIINIIHLASCQWSFRLS